MVKCQCFCNHFACDGKLVDKRTQLAHADRDRKHYILNASAATSKACKDQDEDIANYISRLTLSGNVSQTPLPIDKHDLATPPSHRQRVEQSLASLKVIEEDIGRLTDSVLPILDSLDAPVDYTDVFPLISSVSTCKLLQTRLENVSLKSPAIQETKKILLDRLDTFLQKLCVAQTKWNKELRKFVQDSKAHTSNLSRTFNSEHHHEAILPNAQPIIQTILFLVVVMRVLLNTSRRGCRFMLHMLRYVIQLAFLMPGTKLSALQSKILRDFPRDPDTATSKFNLDAQHYIYAVCPNPSCHKTYKPEYIGSSPIPIYPKYCTHKKFLNGNKCKTRLTRPSTVKGVNVEVAIKCFVYYSFTDFVANLTSRPGFEARMDAAWNDIRNASEIAADIFDGEFLRSFKGPDGKLFADGGLEGRYAFNMSVDFFNPFMNKQAGKKCSIGVISLVCLNLPPSMRYKPENMFLAGVVPGPNEPPLTALNHYLTPLVDELLAFWETGVYFSRTHDYPKGRLILCALIALICDLPAARKTAGFAAASHEHFCSICHCTRTQQGYGNTDTASWRRRTNEECRRSADHWNTAEDIKARTEIFNATGIRWSELLRLPYFDVTRCVVVDSMHNLFLGLIKNHFYGILGIALPTVPADSVVHIDFGTIPEGFTAKERKSVEKLRNWLQAPIATTFPPPNPTTWSESTALHKLKLIHLRVLRLACEHLHCPFPDPAKPPKTKHEWADCLLRWRRQVTETQAASADTGTRNGHVLSKEDVENIWLDLQNMVTPTWFTSVPYNVGNSATGKLKADQWRALGTTHLPLSLIHQWGLPSTTANSKRKYEILEVTMHLISAVVIATSRTTSLKNADSYLFHMEAYLTGIKQLFPDYKFRPNHHMALHIRDYLVSFGPVQAWWTFPFERLIGMLQRLPNNGKMGELEDTISSSFTRAANLRALPLKAGCPEVIENCKAIFSKLLDPQLRDTLPTDTNVLESLTGTDESPDDINEIAWDETLAIDLPNDLREAFTKYLPDTAPRKARFWKQLVLKGLNYAVSSKHLGNSCVLIQTHSMVSPVPAEIQYIIQVVRPKGPQMYIGVCCYHPANLMQDPYASFPIIRAQLWDRTPGALQIIETDNIVCHFARLSVDLNNRDLFATLSLSRIYEMQ